MTVTVLNAHGRSLLEGRLPHWVEPRWFGSPEDLLALAPDAEIGWFDTFDFGHAVKAYHLAEKAKWLNTMAAGVDPFPLDVLRERGVIFTNGAGLNAVAIAEYAVMGMLTIAKGWREVVRAQERREWLDKAPGTMSLHGSRALVVGAGGIGGRIAHLLRGLDVEVTEARRRATPGVLGADEWRGALGEVDWVVVAVPSTPDTVHLFGPAEFAAMKRGATILNFARGAVLDQQALMAALDSGQVGAAFLDVTDPEPLPPGHPLWSYDQVHISMHLSGRSQDTLYRLGAERFLENLDRYARGEPLVSEVDLVAGY